MRDPEIDALEADLRESRFKPWDVETFLANRHQAKIEALTAPGDPWQVRKQVAKELATGALTFIGYVTVVSLLGLWLVLGEFPLSRGMFN